MPGRPHKMLTPEQVARFLEMWTGGCSYNEIGRQFDVSRATVIAWGRDRFGLPLRSAAATNLMRRRSFEVRDTEPAGAYDNLPAARLHGLPARPRPGDRPGERWIQLR